MNKNNSNLEWADNIRCIATIFVVTIHVIFPVVDKFSSVNYLYWNIANFVESLCRSAVPLFVMLTGALLIGKQESINYFFSKRINKIAVPFVLWFFIYLVIAYVSDFTFGNFDQDKLTWFTDKISHGSAYHLWYIYMILGLYLVIPYLSKMTVKMQTNDYFIFFAVWVITLSLNFPLIQKYFPIIDFKFFTGYIGYLLLGYFLSIKEFKYLNKKSGILLLIIGWVLTAIPTWIISSDQNKLNNIFYNYLTPNVALMAIGIFVVIKGINVKNSYIYNTSKIISKYSYGIYLNHVFMITILYKLGLDWSKFNPLIGVFFTFIMVVIFSISFVWISERLKIRSFFG